MKNFLSKEHFIELKALISIQVLAYLFGLILINSSQVILFMEINRLSYFNFYSFLATIFLLTVTSVADPKKYFNLASWIASGSFSYWAFWFMFELVLHL